ncbi:hypothetical protein BGP_5384 [Beggiatoa sp. PS]|nr:hypothetical protein BGP_5384 [Beggiatoa sp. PS]
MIKQNAHPSITEWENEIKQLVQNHRIMEARQRLSQASKAGILSTTLKEWQLVLKEPQVSVKNEATGVGLNENYQWLKKNARQFKGLWVALSKGVLIDSHDNLTTLRQILEKSGKLTNDIAFMPIEN